MKIKWKSNEDISNITLILNNIEILEY